MTEKRLIIRKHFREKIKRMANDEIVGWKGLKNPEQAQLDEIIVWGMLYLNHQTREIINHSIFEQKETIRYWKRKKGKYARKRVKSAKKSIKDLENRMEKLIV